MNPLTQIILLLALVVALLVVLFYLLSVLNKRKEKVLTILWNNYQTAIASGNKQRALNAGRAYYAARRGTGRLTIYDEQAIANDLSAMK